jgi:hypothetical protein
MELFSKLHVVKGTRANHTSMARRYMEVCTLFGWDSSKPLGEYELCVAIVWWCRYRKVTTIKNFVAGVQEHYVSCGLGVLPRGELYQRVKSGLEHVYGAVEVTLPMLGLSAEELLKIRAEVTLKDLVSACVWCAIVFGWNGLFRVGEYCDGALRCQDVKATSEGMEITVQYSKTERHPVVVCLAKRADALCPVSAYWTYMIFRPAIASGRKDAFFVVDGKGTRLSVSRFVGHLKVLVSEVLGLDSTRYAGHSLRRGGTTAMTAAGVPEVLIQAHGRWKSLAYRGYVELRSDAVKWRPTQIMASHT